MQGGRNDRTNRVLAPCQCTINGTQCPNIHISMGFNADENDPSTRFLNITQGYESLNALEEAITESLTQVQEGSRRHLLDIMDDVAAANRYLENSNNDRARAFFKSCLNQFETQWEHYEDKPIFLA